MEDSTVLNEKGALGVAGGRCTVGDHQDCLPLVVNVSKEVENLVTGIGV